MHYSRGDLYYISYLCNLILYTHMESVNIFESLKAHVNSISPLSDEMLVLLFEKMDVTSLNKRELLLNEGARNDKVFFLVSGLIRIYTIKDGIERIADFIKPGFFVNILSQSLFTPISKVYVEAMEQCAVLSIDSHELECLYSSSVEFANWGRVYAEKEVTQFNHFFSHLYFLSPTELYEEALKSMGPLLLQKIPLKYLASYLNITPESLSRIRKRIVSKEVK